MPCKVVAMARIPWRWKNYRRRCSDLRYADYSELSWRWWCANHDMQFVIIDQPLGNAQVQALPPTFQRWFALERLLSEYGHDAQVAMVDADTMVRWDTPDFFDLAGQEFAAVRDWHGTWAYSSIAAYQQFFPETTIPWWDYFNTGLVLLNQRHLKLTGALIDFALAHKRELANTRNPWGYGDDQTVLNFIVRQNTIPILFLHPTFNVIHCVQNTSEIRKLERMRKTPSSLSVPLYDTEPPFIKMGYIWHFTNVLKARPLVMEETWKRICAHYP